MYIKRTTLEIDGEDETYVKSRAMTYRGAFKAGIQALRERDENRANMLNMERNIAKLQERVRTLMIVEEANK